MSELQLSLLVLGAVVIGGVYLFNRWQERRFRTQAEQVFRRDHPDVLLTPDAAAIQPVGAAGSEEAVPMPRSKRAAPTPIEPSLKLDAVVPSTPLDARIHYIASMRTAEPVAVSALKAAVEHFRFGAKPVRWQGRNLTDDAWEDIVFTEGGGPYSEFHAAVPLASRAGALTDNELASFVGMMKNVSERSGGKLEFPDERAALQRAEVLDAFCAQVDVAIDFNVVSKDGATLPGTKIRAMAEAEGMVLRADGVFVMRDEQGQDLFTLANQEPRPFLPDQVRTISTHAVVFSLDVPRVKDAPKVLQRMSMIAQQFAHGVGGMLVDERRRELRDSQIQQIRTQLQDIVGTMVRHEIPSGSALAQQLFSE